jgi:hypothetical protein
MNQSNNHSPITAQLVAEENRLSFLPNAFGKKLMMLGETYTYDWLGVLANGYRGGYWNYYTLSNGGFYLAPLSSKQLRIRWPGNYFDGMLSADAAGIVATLFAINQLCHESGSEALVDQYYRLIAYANEHKESAAITMIID